MTENALAAMAAKLLTPPASTKAVAPTLTVRTPAPFVVSTKQPGVPAPRREHTPPTTSRPDVRHHEDVSAAYQSAPNPKPTKARLETRQGSPSGDGYVTSGIDKAMHDLANELHKPKARPLVHKPVRR